MTTLADFHAQRREDIKEVLRDPSFSTLKEAADHLNMHSANIIDMAKRNADVQEALDDLRARKKAKK